ncbi:uncharacterized protein [Ptychodera flava]|uniref:uncharacterized protein n=1 Tax=Ptychodera flava TaxID=63121 RepID=UPI00396A3D47
MIVTARVAFLILQVVRAVDMMGIGVIDNDYNSVDYVYPKIDPAAYDIRTLQCRTSTYVKTYDSCFHGNGTRCGDAVFLPVYRDNMWECHCDYNCKLYGECCHDFERACADHDWQEEDKIEIAERIIPTDPRMEPTDNPIGGAWQRCQLAENTDYRGLWVTHGCPGDWTDGYVRRLCTDDLAQEERESLSNTNIALLDTPVVSTGSYKVYANVFCSVCHGENETDIFYFLTKWNCFRRNNLNDILDNDVDHVVGELSNFQDCTVTHDLPVYSSRVRSCTEYLSTCDPTLFSDDELFALWESFCQSNFSMCETGVTVPNTYFKNHYCGYCNGYQINFCGITGEGSGGNTIPT